MACPAVAVFWIDAEDHDWDEVEVMRLRARRVAGASRHVAREPAGCGRSLSPVARVHTRRRPIGHALADAGQARSPQTNSPRPDGRDAAHRRIRQASGCRMRSAGGWNRSSGRAAWSSYNSADPAAKPLAADRVRPRNRVRWKTARRPRTPAPPRPSARATRAQVTAAPRTPSRSSTSTTAVEAIQHPGRFVSRRRGPRIRRARLLERVRQAPA